MAGLLSSLVSGIDFGAPRAAFSLAVTNPTPDTVFDVLRWTVEGVGLASVSLFVGLRALGMSPLARPIKSYFVGVMDRLWEGQKEAHERGGIIAMIFTTVLVLPFQLIPYVSGAACVLVPISLAIGVCIDIVLSAFLKPEVVRFVHDIVGIFWIYRYAAKSFSSNLELFVDAFVKVVRPEDDDFKRVKDKSASDKDK